MEHLAMEEDAAPDSEKIRVMEEVRGVVPAISCRMDPLFTRPAKTLKSLRMIVKCCSSSSGAGAGAGAGGVGARSGLATTTSGNINSNGFMMSPTTTATHDFDDPNNNHDNNKDPKAIKFLTTQEISLSNGQRW